MSGTIIPFPSSVTKVEEACREIRALRDRALAEMLLEIERLVEQADRGRRRTDALLDQMSRDARSASTGQGR